MEEDEKEDWWHSVWSAGLATTLIVVFYPWSLLVLILFLGWDETIDLLKILFFEALGIVGFIIFWLIVILHIVGLGFIFYFIFEA
jgi:hypothetical protein